jgi:polyisoprenyl-teichoic acid--peptidoglycan teichoic acid transferase
MKSRTVAILSLMFAALLAVPGSAFAQTPTQPDVASEPLTILLMVSDAREGEEIDSGAADVIAVVHLDPETQSCRALNVLPNTRVQIEGVGNTRINQALSQGGVEMAVDTVESYLGIEIDHYGVIDLEGVITAIDAVGGVTLNNPVAFSVGGNDFPAGELTLSGEQALLYARADGQQDTQGRLDMQKALVEGLISSIGSADLGSGIPAAVQGSVADIQDHILTDITLDTALEAANAYSTCVPEEETVETVMFTEEGPQLDEATQDEQISGATDPAEVEAHAEWLINGGELPSSQP